MVSLNGFDPQKAARQQIDKEAVKAAVQGRFAEVFTALTAISLDDKERHGPCPKCAGSDRFRFDRQKEFIYCNQCGKDLGDIFSAVQWATGWGFPETLRSVANFVGIGPPAEVPKADILATIARAKHVPPASFEAYGAERVKNGIRFPTFGGDGQNLGAFTIYATGSDQAKKGLTEEGTTPGMFLPINADGSPRLPQAGESWLVVEGCKDSAALHGLGYLAAGMPNNKLPQWAVPLFRDVHVNLLPDRDKGGEDEAAHTLAKLHGVAASEKQTTLPTEFRETGGDDVRDVLKKRDGERLLREAIDNAKPWRKAAGPEPLTADKFVVQYPELRPAIIEGLVREGETANIVSVTKAGKSWLVLNLIFAVLLGIKFLGLFVTRPGKIVLFDNELQPQTLAYRLRMVARKFDAEHVLKNLIVIPCRGRMIDIHGVGKILEQFQPGEVLLVILDAWYRFIPTGIRENENEGLKDIYNEIDSFAERLGCAFINIHHSSKGGQGDKRVTDVGSGGSAQSRAADCHIVLREHEQPGVLVADYALRSFPPLAPVCISLDWPMWKHAPDCDATQLKRDRGQGGRPRGAKDTIDANRKAAKEVWTPQKFAADIIGPVPKTKAEIFQIGEQQGISNYKMRSELLPFAEQLKLIHRHADGFSSSHKFSTLTAEELAEDLNGGDPCLSEKLVSEAPTPLSESSQGGTGGTDSATPLSPSVSGGQPPSRADGLAILDAFNRGEVAQ